MPFGYISNDDEFHVENLRLKSNTVRSFMKTMFMWQFNIILS